MRAADRLFRLLPSPCVGLLIACATGHGVRSGYLDFVPADVRPPIGRHTVGEDSLYGSLEGSARGDGVAESRRDDLDALVRRFTPTLVLPKKDNTTYRGRRYQLIPTNASLLADTLQMDFIRTAPHEFADSADIPLADLSLDELVALVDSGLRYEGDPELLCVWYFDFPGTTPREWWAAYGALRAGPDSALWSEPTVYAHPFLARDGRVVIQYWFLYPFNDFIGNHEGDWEHINVVVSDDWQSVEEVHYYFHHRSVRLPQGRYQPEIEDETHPVVYVGGRMYNVLDFLIRLFAGERNEGAHGTYPYPGEWEAAAGLGAPESVSGRGGDPLRIVSHRDFRVILTPEPSLITYREHPDVLRDWAWLLLPVRWGFPTAPSLGSELGSDVGNRGPYGPAYNAAWHRTAPGMTYPGYTVHRVSAARAFVEDLLQPWYYLYIFRQPRFINDVRAAGMSRAALERLGLMPRSGWHERGVGSPVFGVHVAQPTGHADAVYERSTGISLWRNFWGKIRFGAFEVMAGYQKFRRDPAVPGATFVYPLTANLAIRAPQGRLRPYGTIGGGAYGWETRRLAQSGEDLVANGWSPGWTVGVGTEYYLRPKVALDVAIRHHATRIPSARTLAAGDRFRFTALWVGHYVRF